MLDAGLLLLLLLLIVVALAALPPVRPFVSRAYARLRGDLDRGLGRPRRPRAHTGVTIISGTGEEFDLPAERTPTGPSWGSRIEALMNSKRLLVALVVILIALLAFLRLPRAFPSEQPGQFVVLVAPFRDMDGTVGQTGRSVADQLAQILPAGSGGRVVARVVAEPPADSDAALALMARTDADALIWGHITPGGMLDEESLLPLLAYRPTGAFAPAGWDGYTGRFAMPPAFVLSDARINGQAVLPRLLGAIADYGTGQVDSAFTTLGDLTRDYPALTSALPYALRGNILWARGEYVQAAGEYRRGLAPETERWGAGREQAQVALPDPRAPLTNNLGAILQDDGDPAAHNTFAQAIALLGGQDLGALRYNLGIEALRAGQAGDAVSSLEQARSLLPPATSPLLTLSEAYRLDGKLDSARETLDAARQQIGADAAATTPAQRDLTTGRLRVSVAEQDALLRLAQLLQARGPLLWELQASDPLPQAPLGNIRADLAQAVKETDQLAQGWRRRSVAEDADHHPIAGLLAIGQSRRAERLLREQQRWQATVEIEIGRARGVQPRRGIAALWDRLVGDRSPLGQGRAHLEELLATEPNDVDSLVLLGRALRIGDDPSAAAERFNQAAAAAPQRPEPVYGQALVALPGDPAQARQLLTKAIALDDRYFPAHQKLAEIAEAQGDLTAAIEQRRWLALHRPSAGNTLVLARTLRVSGQSGYAEAERVLLPLANDGNVKALLELSRLYRAYGDQAAAHDVLERAQEIAPNDPDVAYELGQLLAAQGDSAGAKAEYQRAIDAQPGHIGARLALAQLSAGDVAAQQYRAALDAGASDPAALKQIGAVLLARGDYERATSAYERAAAVTPDDPELQHGLAQAYLQRNRLDAAEAAERRALDLKGGVYPEALVGLGDIARQRGRSEEAVQQYNAALRQNDRLSAAYIGLGRAAADAGNWSVAQGHFQNAVAHDGTSAEAHLWLGEALIRQGDTNQAIAEYTRALALNPDYAEAHFGLAQARMSAGQLAEAGQSLDKALALRPDYAEALLLQGKLAEQLGDDARAIDSYSRSIKANGRLAEPHYLRAKLYIRQDRMSDAEGDLEAATRIQPNFPEGHYWLGRTYLAEGRAQAAREQFQQAIDQRGGNYAEAQFYQGLAQERLGQRSDAIASFQAALEQDRNSAWAGEAQDALIRLGQP